MANQNNPDYRIVNPGAGDDYFDNAGTAYDNGSEFSGSSTQPAILVGRSKGLGANQDLLNNIGHGITVDAFGSVIVSGLTHTRASITGAPNFATMVAGSYIMRRVTTTIAGQASVILRSGGHTQPGIIQSVHKVRTGIRHDGSATAIRAGNWDIFSGTYSSITATNNSIGDVSGGTVTDGSADHATPNTTPPVDRTIPGELVYKEPRPLPFQADYSSKTS